VLTDASAAAGAALPCATLRAEVGSIYEQELDLALHMVREAGREIMKHYQTALVVEAKRDHSPVTIADRNAEELVRTIIARETPAWGVVGEELGVSNAEHARRWFIDPIDGTKSFVCGVPLFGTLLALVEDGVPLVGVIALHALGHTLWARKGGGAFVDGCACRVSDIETLEEAVLLDGCQTTIERLGYGDAWQGLRQRAKVARGWGDCYGHFLVATGRAEVMFDPVAMPWDIAPLGVILAEAGGRFGGVYGDTSVEAGSGVSTNGRLHSTVLAELARVPRPSSSSA
jgi:histidinol-phosphatase